jgi:D-psicose/D-tagatose/L-ribulose 3-epimerase
MGRVKFSQVGKLAMRPTGIHLSYWTSHWSDDVFPFLQKARDAGFDGAELPLLDPGTMRYGDLRRQADQLGLRLTCCTGLPVDGDISHPDPGARQRGVDHLMRCLDGAAEVGSPVLAGVLYLGWGAAIPESGCELYIQRSAEVLRHVAVEAGKRHVTLCLEVLNRFESFFLNTVEEGRAFLNKIGSPFVKLNLDTCHLNIEEDSVAGAIRQAGKQLGHLHCTANNRKRPGLGHLPWDEIKQALDAIDYQGWLIMECFVRSGDEVGRTMRIWRPLSVDLDADARAGANFLKTRLS